MEKIREFSTSTKRFFLVMYILCPTFQFLAKWNRLREFSTLTKRFFLVMYILCHIFQFLAKWNRLREFSAPTKIFLFSYVPLGPFYSYQQNGMDYASLAHQLKDYI